MAASLRARKGPAKSGALEFCPASRRLRPSSPLRSAVCSTASISSVTRKAGDFAVEWRFADGKYDRFPEPAADLCGQRRHALWSPPSAGIRAMQQATKTIPIVMGDFVLSDPVGSGLVASLARPGGNTTGLATSQEGRCQSEQALNCSKRPCRSCLAFPRSDQPKELHSCRAGLRGLCWAGGPDVHFLESYEFLQENRGCVGQRQPIGKGGPPRYSHWSSLPVGTALLSIALMQRLPTIFSQREARRSGRTDELRRKSRGLFSARRDFCGQDFQGSEAGGLARSNSRPRFVLIVNLKTAKAIGLTLPELFLLRADEVIE